MFAFIMILRCKGNKLKFQWGNSKFQGDGFQMQGGIIWHTLFVSELPCCSHYRWDSYGMTKRELFGEDIDEVEAGVPGTIATR
jgi:hypothetical protein